MRCVNITTNRLVKFGWVVLIWTFLSTAIASESPKDPVQELNRALTPMVGRRDAVLVTSPDGATLVSIHADKLLVPASILKLITVSAALYHLGADFRFKTEFYQDNSNNLIIKGYGDPLMISERIADIAIHLSGLLPSYNHLILDDAYFAENLVIPGRTVTEEPYDAPNGALCVNFNTVAFRREKGQWISAEPQTPLLANLIPKIEASGLKTGRITLAADSDEARQYTGGLFKYFFNQQGLNSNGSVDRGLAQPGRDRLIWRYRSATDLWNVSQLLLEFSNNFMANQILLVMGAEIHGPPATLDKGLKVLRRYASEHLGMNSGRIVEASGISRQNRVSAQTVENALIDLESNYQLLRRTQGNQFYKTGHLNGIRTRAGYITSRQGGHYRFVIILNTPGKTTRPIMRIIERRLQ